MHVFMHTGACVHNVNKERGRGGEKERDRENVRYQAFAHTIVHVHVCVTGDILVFSFAYPERELGAATAH